MIDETAQKPMQGIFRQANRTFLQYVSQATPWFRDRDKALVDKINQLAAEEVEGLTKLAQWMDSHGISLPYLGAFPSSFTNFNFVDIRKLLEPLIAEQQREFAKLEKEGKLLPDPDARRAVEELAQLNRKHLGTMEELSRSLAA